jgi:hypothetical protein
MQRRSSIDTCIDEIFSYRTETLLCMLNVGESSDARFVDAASVGDIDTGVLLCCPCVIAGGDDDDDD